MTDKELVLRAVTAREKAYAPYSGFCVGAALLTESGKVYTGCNIENASLGATICAERVAMTKAVSAGERKFAKIAIVGGKEGEDLVFCSPCGICRQFMAEFTNADFPVILGTPNDFRTYTLNELLLLAFTPKDLSVE